MLDKQILPVIGKLPIGQITPEIIGYVTTGKKEYSPRSKNAVISVIRSVCEYAASFFTLIRVFETLSTALSKSMSPRFKAHNSAAVTPNYRKTSYDSYLRVLDKQILPVIGELPIGQITPEIIGRKIPSSGSPPAVRYFVSFSIS